MIDDPSKEQLAWAHKYKFMCNVTSPMIKLRPEKPPKPITMVKPRPREVVSKKAETKPPGRPPGKKQPGRPVKRIESEKE